MALTISINGLTISHKGSNGLVRNTLPDVCKTPSPGGPVPIPYPVIISRSADLVGGTIMVKADGEMVSIKGSQLSRCTGDEAGTAGGVKSSTNLKEAKWLLYSFDVKFEGKNVCRLTDKLSMNHENTMCLGGKRQQNGKTPRNNQAQNAQFDGAIKEAERKVGKLNKDQIRQVHDEITGQGYGYHEIVELVVSMFG